MAEINYRFKGTGLAKEEMKWAKKQFTEYRKRYHIDRFSDLQLLEELIFREAISEQLKTKIQQVSETDSAKDKNLIPTTMIESLNDNLEQILILKGKLGLLEEKKEDEYKAFESLEKKFNIWKHNHLEERKTTCPFCSKIFFLNIRTDKFKESKLELFKNKVLCNKHLWEMFKEGKITKTDMALVLNVSEDYITWLGEKIYPSK